MATTKSGGHSKDSDASKKPGAKSGGQSEKNTGASKSGIGSKNK